MVVRRRLASALSWVAAVAVLVGGVAAVLLASWALYRLTVAFPALLLALLVSVVVLGALAGVALLVSVVAGVRDWIWSAWPW